jgi:hypothetical protein
VQGDQLVAVVNNFVTAKFSHWHYDIFRGWYDKKWYGKGMLNFSLGLDGTISKVNFDGMEFDREKKP